MDAETINEFDNFFRKPVKNIITNNSNEIKTGYKCNDCNTINYLGYKDQIMCSKCENRVLYKIRTKKPIEHMCR